MSEVQQIAQRLIEIERQAEVDAIAKNYLLFIINEAIHADDPVEGQKQLLKDRLQLQNHITKELQERAS